MKEVVVDEANASRRLDSFVRKWLPDSALGEIMRAIRTRKIRVNGKKQKGDYRLVQGDVVSWPDSFASTEPEAKPAKPTRPAGPPIPKLGSDLVYADDDVLIVYKAAGLACHPGTKHDFDTLSSRVLVYAEQKAGVAPGKLPPGHRPGLAQRLDRGVSGLIPVGLHAQALRALALAVENNTIEKVYFALVWGTPKNKSGDIRLALRVDDEPMGDRPRTHPDPNGQSAHTHYEVVQSTDETSLLRVTITTGRTHQIRAHLRAMGHPIVGDPRYGEALRDQAMHQTYGIARPLLHAGEVSFAHPRTGEMISRKCDLPKDMQRVLFARRKK